MATRGRYNLLRKIADGGTAEVFLAHMEGSAGFKRLVVLKRVRTTLWADESFRKGLLDEAHIMMGLHHSNIVQVLDLGVAAKRYFLAFELVDGWTLSQVVQRSKATQFPMPLNVALHVMAEVCRALAYAHSRSENGVPLAIVHRDVSPQNVLLSEQGEVKLTDFGIARARTRVTTSQIGTVKGKPAFMSPEQADGRELDSRSDLFPIGTMLYQLVTGELPFTAPTALEEMAAVSTAKFINPATRRPDLPREFVALINKALERKVERRFQTADEMVRAIEKVQRTVLEPAGQTELKAWLAALAAKDGGLPLSRIGEVPDSTRPPPPPPEESVPIELEDDDFITLPPMTQLAAPSFRRSAGRWPSYGVAAALLGLGGLWVAAPELFSPWLGKLRGALNLSTPDPDAGSAPTSAGVPPAVVAFSTWDVVDAGEEDAGIEDAESPDAGPADAGPAELGAPDAATEVVVVSEPDLVAPHDAGATAPTPRPAPSASASKLKLPAASPTIATDESVSVLVDTDPSGATVRIDRHVWGTTPMPLRLKIGLAFELVFSKEGYREAKLLHFVTRRNGQRSRVVVLEPAP